MFNIQFYRNVAQKSVVFPLVKSRTGWAKALTHVYSISTRPIPQKSNGIEHRKTDKPYFKENPFNENSRSKFNRSKATESEADYLLRIKNDPDTFGDSHLQEEYLDEGDILEEKHISEKPPPHKRLSTKQYADIIKGFIRQRKIKEAIDILETRMIIEDRVKPENYIYNLLLGACGRVGYTKKAFMLYNDMKKRGLKVTGGTYTALFNACANSPWPTTDGLTRAKHLHDIMIEKGYEPNDTNYNAMIKAFGRCGDLPMAFSLVDEMSQKGFRIKDDTINFLLQACISDKTAGFRHSLLVWRKLIDMNIQPSLYTFNLLLRSIRDCELGDLEVTRDVFDKLMEGKVNIVGSAEANVLQLEAGHQDMNTDDLSNKCEEKLENKMKSNLADVPVNIENQETLRELGNEILFEEKNNLVTKAHASEKEDLRPNLLAKKPHLGNILSLSEVKKPEDRLLLVGGIKGFLETMSEHKCTPDIKTFTQLLDCIPSTDAAEKSVISAMRKCNIEPDIDFYNMLIKKKSLRFDYEGAKAIVMSLRQKKLRPNLITYGVLSLGCQTKEDALELVEEMKKHSYTLNAAILGAMLQQACFHRQYGYIFEIMELCLKEGIPANKKFLGHLDGFKERCKALMEQEKLSKREVKLFGIFKARYKTWLEEVQVDESEEAHPWQQYRQTYPNDVKFKTNDSARFKERRSSLFKVKTSPKHYK